MHVPHHHEETPHSRGHPRFVPPWGHHSFFRTGVFGHLRGGTPGTGATATTEFSRLSVFLLPDGGDNGAVGFKATNACGRVPSMREAGRLRAGLRMRQLTPNTCMDRRMPFPRLIRFCAYFLDLYGVHRRLFRSAFFFGAPLSPPPWRLPPRPALRQLGGFTSGRHHRDLGIVLRCKMV